MTLEVRQITGPADLEKMTEWLYRWWGEKEGNCRESVRCYLSHSLQKDRLPQTFGLYRDGVLIGMYQFTGADLFPRPDLYPWLANVYIDRSFRGLGYGRFLLDTIRENASRLQLSDLYLFTTHCGLYEKYGWQFVEETDTFLNPRVQRLYRLSLKGQRFRSSAASAPPALSDRP